AGRRRGIRGCLSRLPGLGPRLLALSISRWPPPSIPRRRGIPQGPRGQPQEVQNFAHQMEPRGPGTADGVPSPSPNRQRGHPPAAPPPPPPPPERPAPTPRPPPPPPPPPPSPKTPQKNPNPPPP